MKLSSFKKSEYVKKLIFVNGDMESIDVNETLNGEILFYDLDSNIAEKIQEDILKSKKDLSDEEFIYKLIPHLTNIENDVSYKEFLAMYKNPSSEFAEFINGLIYTLKVMYVKTETLVKLKKNSENLINDISSSTSSEEFEKLRQEDEEKIRREKLIDDLYTALNVTTDKNIKKTIIKQISELEGS
jgi:hypothetical protein